MNYLLQKNYGFVWEMVEMLGLKFPAGVIEYSFQDLLKQRCVEAKLKRFYDYL